MKTLRIITCLVTSLSLSTTYAQNKVFQYILNDSIQERIQMGSADRVGEERMNKGLVTTSLDALSGQAAGVNVSSTGADRMAMLSSVRVRGTTSLTGGNDPLVIIDGVSCDLATLSSIYPADIESFTILKNAAETAQYGSRGASGVIEVTTKKGKGGKFHINYSGIFGFESVYKNLHMLNRADYITTAQNLGLAYNDKGYDTDFLSAITRTGLVQNHHVAFSGGSDQSNYRASVAIMDYNTIIRNNKHTNYVAKLDITQKAFNDLMTFELGVFGSSQKSNNLFDVQKLFYSAATQNPTFPYDEDALGTWKKNSTASQITAPDAVMNMKNDEQNMHFNTHARLTFDLTSLFPSSEKTQKGIESLLLKVFGSYSYSSTEDAQFCPTWTWAQGRAYRGEHKKEDLLGNIILTYKNTWNIHHLEASLLGEYQKSRLTGFWTEVKGFTTNAVGYDNLGAASTIPFGGTGSDYEDPKLASAMASISYTLLDTYKLTFTTRADGSSMVGDNNTWGFFPSVSAEWNILKQFPSLPMTTLKLRSGYGTTGNLGGVSSYYSLQRMQQIGIFSINGTPTVTMGIIRNDNPDLKWETRSTFNIGADVGIWKNRVVLTAEYYYSKTTDMLYLYDVPVPPYAYDKMLANIGSMRNTGFELGLGVTPVYQKDMELNINVNLSWQRNKLLSLSGDFNGTYMSANSITPIGGLNGAGFHGGDNKIVYQIVGQPLGVFYLPHCKGVGVRQDNSGACYYEIEDLNHNGVVNIEDGADRYVAGQAMPKMTLGSNIAFRYKNFDISLQMNGAFGHKIYNGTSLTYMNMTSFPDYNVMQGAPERNIKDQTATDYWLERGDYLNFDYLTIAWNVPLRSKFINSLRVSCSVNNLGTITSYSGITPMINSYVVSSTLGIDDKRSYPAYRSYSIGLNISF